MPFSAANNSIVAALSPGNVPRIVYAHNSRPVSRSLNTSHFFIVQPPNITDPLGIGGLLPPYTRLRVNRKIFPQSRPPLPFRHLRRRKNFDPGAFTFARASPLPLSGEINHGAAGNVAALPRSKILTPLPRYCCGYSCKLFNLRRRHGLQYGF